MATEEMFKIRKVFHHGVNNERSKSKIYACMDYALRISLLANGQPLLAQMQNLGYFHGLCVTALRLLSQDKTGISAICLLLFMRK